MTSTQTRPEATSLNPPPGWASSGSVEVLPYGAPRRDWHATRLTGIGGSDALAALNLSPHSNPYKLWLDKSGRLPPFEARGRMAWGNRLEPLVADWFAEVHGKTLGTTGTWRHPVPLFQTIDPCPCGEDMIAAAGHADHCEGPDTYVRWMLANPDRYVIGENAGVEIKTVAAQAPDAKLWNRGEAPDYPLAQAQWCMGATGALGWYIVAAVDGCQEPIVNYVTRDDDLIADMREGAAQLVNDHLYPDVPPPADASAATSEALAAAALARVTDATTIDMPDGADALVARRVDLKARIKALDAELREVENSIKAPLVEAGAEYGRIGGRVALRLAKRRRAGYTVKPGEYVELRKVASK